MKNSFLIAFLFFFSIKGFATDKISYLYDAAGNRTLRKYEVELQRAATSPQQSLDSVMVEAIQGPLNVTVFPNPTKGALAVKITGLTPEEKISMSLYSPQGVQLQSIDIIEETTPINMSAYPSGWYILRIVANNKPLEFKIIKE